MPSDTSNNDGPAAGTEPGSEATGGAETAQQVQEVPIHFSLQYVKDLSFENPNAPEIYQSFQEPNVNVNVNVAANNLDDRTFEVTLKLAVTAKSTDDTGFLAELEYCGIAHVGESVEEQNVRPLVLIEGPRLLFPFARSILANLTRDSAFPMLLLGPMDFVKMYSDSVTAQQAQASQA